jgi:hypothetical protein
MATPVVAAVAMSRSAHIPAAMAVADGQAVGAGPVEADGVDAIFIGFPRYFL